MINNMRRHTSRYTNNRNAVSSKAHLYSRNPHGLLVRLHNHRIGAEEAVESLEKTNAYGRCVAGEICVELAYKTSRIEDTAAFLARARHNFEVSSKSTVSTMQGHSARALLHLAQLPNHAIIASTGKLPVRSQALKAYESTVAAGEKIAEAFHEATIARTKSVIDLAGVASEASALTLGQRYALWSGIDSETWFPMTSFFSEDHRNADSPTKTNRAWDMNIYQKHDSHPLDTAYRVQIKSSPHKRDLNDAKPEADIVTLYLRPDLQIQPHEAMRVTTIIMEAAAEMEADAGASARLDVRTEHFLDKLDSSVPPSITA